MPCAEVHIPSMPHALRAALLVCLCLPAPAAAVMIQFSGTVTFVSDDFNRLDASVDADAPATVVSGTYTVDPTSPDPSSPFEVGPAQLVFQLGNYLFDTSQNPHEIALIDDRVASTDPFVITLDVWQSLAIFSSDLDPATNPAPSAGYVAQIEFFDFSSSHFDGTESAPFVPSSLAGWDQVWLTLNSVDGSGSLDDAVEVEMAIDTWSVQPVPEPRSAALLAFGLASLALRARRRVRVR